MNLDTDIRGIPLKYWLVIAAGGIGIGYLVTRNPGNRAGGMLPGSTAQVKASNDLNAKITVENMRREAVIGNYEQYTANLQQQAQSFLDTIASVEKATAPQPANPRQLQPLQQSVPGRPQSSGGSIRQQIRGVSTITSLV